MTKYTKPHVLSTVNANAAIQNGTGTTHTKVHPMVQDNINDPASRSTTGAYPGENE